MSICGFNDLIGEGIERLVDGMIVAMQLRVERTGRPMRELVAQELDELAILTAALEKRQTCSAYGMFCGLNVLAVSFFQQVAVGMDRGLEFEAAARHAGKHFIDVLMKAEAQHDVLRADPGTEVPIVGLARWLSKQPDGSAFDAPSPLNHSKTTPVAGSTNGAVSHNRK